MHKMKINILRSSSNFCMLNLPLLNKREIFVPKFLIKMALLELPAAKLTKQSTVVSKKVWKQDTFHFCN